MPIDGQYLIPESKSPKFCSGVGRYLANTDTVWLAIDYHRNIRDMLTLVINNRYVDNAESEMEADAVARDCRDRFGLRKFLLFAHRTRSGLHCVWVCPHALCRP